MELFVRGNTDTAHPQDIVPIYFIHTIQHPLCNRPDCWCHANEAQVKQLLEAAKEQKVMLAEAGGFIGKKAR